MFAYDAAARRVEMLHKLLPEAVAMAKTTNPSDPNIALETDAVRARRKYLACKCVS